MRWALRFHRRELVVALLTAGLICALIRPASADPEFMTQQIGWRVHYFEPVDINGDGIWELALQVGNNADSVGVYSPLLRKWIDGPHWLPVSGNNWGCGDFDQDGQVEYVYLDGSSVHSFNPSNMTDSVTFSVEFTSGMMQLWGTTDIGEPIINLAKNASGESCCDGSCMFCYEWWYYIWHRYSITTGQHIDTLFASRQKGIVNFSRADRPIAYLCVFGFSQESAYAPDFLTSLECGYSISLLPKSSLAFHRIPLARYQSFGGEPIPPCWGGFYIDKIILGSTEGNGKAELFWQIGYYNIGARFTGADIIPVGKRGNLYFAVDWQNGPNDKQYDGMAFGIWFDYPAPILLLPLSNQNCWEVRDPQTGALIDSIPGLPPADIRTAPIIEPDVLDLYYFLDSTLYLLDRPGMPTGILIDNNNPSPPLKFRLHQNFPNPFNASTIIEFELDKPRVAELAVYNILGKKVIVLLNEHRSAGPQQIIWDGTDRDGHPVVSGIYFYRITTNNHTQTKKMVLLK